jgi:hypothetical protein
MKVSSSAILFLMMASMWLIPGAVSAQSSISPIKTNVVFKKKTDPTNFDGVVELSWTTNFSCKKTKVTMTIKNGTTSTTEHRQLGFDADSTGDGAITRTPQVDNNDQISTLFQTKLKFGGSEIFGPKTDSLIVQITANDASGAELTRTDDVPLNLIKQLFKMSSTSQVTPGAAPAIKSLVASDVTTSSMKIGAISTDENIFAMAIAVATSNVADAKNALAGANQIPTVKSDTVACLKNKQCVFPLSSLDDGKAYIVFVKEVDPPNASIRAAALSEPLMNLTTGGPLATLSSTDGPKVAIVGKPINIKNEQVTIKAQISRARKVEVRLLEFDKAENQFKEKAKKEFTLPPEFEKANDRDWTESVPFALKEGNEYQIQMLAFSPTPGMKENETKSTDTFKGLPLKLFENLQLDVTNPALELKPVGANEPLKLVASARAGGVEISFTCKDGETKCMMDTRGADFISQIRTTSSTTTDSSTASVQAVLKITVTASAKDDSQRSQSQVFELTFTGQPKSSPSGSKFSNFVKSVFGGSDDDKTLHSKQMRGTGFGSIVGMILRAFL